MKRSFNIFMKNFLIFLLISSMIFSSIFCANVFALGDDVDLDFNEDVATVTIEDGADAGYIISDAHVYTAVPYNGNEFLGWYNKEDGSLFSTELQVNLRKGEYVAKFKDNNILSAPSAGYELSNANESCIGKNWNTVSAVDWRGVNVSGQYAKSGSQSLKLCSRKQGDVYTDIQNLESNTYYIVSYYWMLPKSVITATETSGDGYFGSAIGTTACSSISNAVAEGLGGDYHETKFTNFVGGQWNKVEYVFYSGDNTDLRMFISYDSALSSGNDFLYMDEFTVFKAPDQEAVATYKATVSAENGYAYSMVSGYVPSNTEVSVIATPFGGYTFDGWYENGVKVSSENIYTFNIQANRNLVAKCVPSMTSTPYIPDIDSNGKADLKDLVLLARYVAEWDVVINATVADVDDSGEVDLDDVKLLAKYCAKWDVEEKMPSEIITNALPEEDLTSDDLKSTLLAGESEYYNKSTVINEGNNARIAKVLKKAQNGEDITVVEFGGSITQGAGTSSANDQYCVRVANWLRAKFPNIKVNYTNAGIGATTSLVGVHRMDKQILELNPDLVIVDFTTNDGGNDTRYASSYEAVIRRLLEDDIAVISVIFGAVSNYDANNGEGKNTRSDNALKNHLPSMVYYDIPTIDYFGSLWRYIGAGVIKWTDVGYDYIHPNRTGHLMAASAINYYLSTVLNDLDNIDTTVPEIPTEYLFDSAKYNTATFISADAITPTSNTNFDAGYVHGTKIPKGWVCTNANGGILELELKGVTSITLFLQYKAGNGKGEVSLNEKIVIQDAYCNNSSESGYIWFAYQEFFDEPTDVVLKLTCDGNFGLAPIGVTYANN